MIAAEGLLSPDGTELGRDAIRGERLWRFRASGIDVGRFLDVMDRFETLDHDTVTADQRAHRRDQLIEHFGGRPLPLFDLYVNDEREELPFLLAALVPGTWYFVVVEQRDDDDARLPIFVGAPGLDPGPYRPGSLQMLDAVPPYIEYRLRDIFSLVHVPDAGLERVGGATPPHSPDDPKDDFLSADPFIRVRDRLFADRQFPEAEA